MNTARRGPRFEATWDANDWLRMLLELGVAAATAAEWAPAFASEVQPARFSAGMFDVRALVPQILHETGLLKRLQENLCYSAKRIREVWPSRFKSELDALPYAGLVSGHEPDMRAAERLGNKVYANRLGNGAEASGDGFRYRGRGAIQVTGRSNYIWLGEHWGQDLEGLPQLLEQPHFALESAVFWWEGKLPDSALSDQVKVRKIVNGGDIGLAHCQELYALGCKVLA